jgi:hypothetical protein
MAPAALEQKGAISLCGIVVQFLNRKAVACTLLATWRCGVFLMLALVRQMWLFEKCNFPFFFHEHKLEGNLWGCWLSDAAAVHGINRLT